MKIETLRLLAILALVAMGVLYFARQPRAQENRAVENHRAVTPTAADLASAPKVTKSDADWKAQLTPAQYAVARAKGTEPPGSSALLREHRHGIFRCVACDAPLFASDAKFESGTGWPSFTKPLVPANIVEKTDRKFFMARTEVRSKHADSHLGHVFDDGPAPTGQRFCMNSASMRFIPVDKLQAEGYGEYLPLFGKAATGTSDSSGKTVHAKTETATIAGGCFWGAQDLLRKLPGVISSRVGYTGGSVKNATYQNHEGHAEAVEVIFDPTKISYEQILEFFFKMHDPTTLNRQGNDVGSSYRSAIFYHDEHQRQVAEQVKKMVDASGAWKRPVVTEIVPAKEFWNAEEYHQDYLIKNPGGYTCHYVRNISFDAKK
jgi:methionine-S-sulfoxide reductase/methionine-R-sulfoxide reductase